MHGVLDAVAVDRHERLLRLSTLLCFVFPVFISLALGYSGGAEDGEKHDAQLGHLLGHRVTTELDARLGHLRHGVDARADKRPWRRNHLCASVEHWVKVVKEMWGKGGNEEEMQLVRKTKLRAACIQSPSIQRIAAKGVLKAYWAYCCICCA